MAFPAMAARYGYGLWYLINGSWSFVDNTYTAYNSRLNKGCDHLTSSGIHLDR